MDIEEVLQVLYKIPLKVLKLINFSLIKRLRSLGINFKHKNITFKCSITIVSTRNK